MDPSRTASKGPRTPSTAIAPGQRGCTTLDRSSRPPNDRQTRRSDAFGEYCGVLVDLLCQRAHPYANLKPPSMCSRLMTPPLAAVDVWTPPCARVAGGVHARQDARLARVKVLAELLRRKGWHRDTSYWPDRWLAHRPSTGQCAVTALIVQDQFGGQIVEAKTNQGEAHFLNRLPGLGDIDITGDQFDSSVEIHVCGIADRKAILSCPDTVRRYKLLKNAVLEHT